MIFLLGICIVALLVTWRHGAVNEPTSFNAFSTWDAVDGHPGPHREDEVPLAVDAADVEEARAVSAGKR